MLGWFRRHAMVLMVVLGSSAMVIFGLGPVFDTLSRGGGGGGGRIENPVIATWSGGEITRFDLDRVQRGHYQSRRFLSALVEAAGKKSDAPVRSLSIPIQPIQDGKRSMVDDQLVGRLLMSERAKKEGVVVSDAAVDDYFVMTSGDAGFSVNDWEAINSSVNRNCTLQDVRDHMKIELLADQMQRYALTGIPMVPNPTESMELYGRSMDQIECEVYPIKVEDYLAKVTGTPSGAELKKLYEEGKYEFADSTGEKPGFKVGRKANVQYVVANFDTFLQNEINKLTDEDVQKEYDRLVAEKNEMVLEPPVAVDNSIEMNEAPPTDGGADTPGDVTPPPADAGSDIEPPPATTEDEPAKTDATPSATEETPSKTEETPAKTESDESAEAGEVKESETKKDDQSYSIRKQKFQFVSTIQETEEATDEKKPDPPQETTGETKPTETTPSAPADTTAATAADQEEVGGIDIAMEETPDTTEEPERKIKPLKDCAEEIKRSLAMPPARKAMEDAIARAEIQVGLHFNIVMQAEDESGKIDEALPEFNFQSTAKEYGLDSGETGLVDDLELEDEAIGKVQVFMNTMVQGRQMPRLIPVSQLVFNTFEDVRLYDSQTVNDWTSQSIYLFWLAEKTETRIPSFAECKPAIEKFWKKNKAYELAMADAEKIKDELNNVRGKKMSEVKDGERVFQTGAFTWFSSIGRTVYSNPTSVDNAGEEFMKTAFSLEELQSGVAGNMSRDTIYVVQSLTGPREASETGLDYLENQFFKYKRIPTEVLRASQVYGRELNLTWNEELQKTMSFKYIDR
ncbi:MAG: hypothetical protein AB8B55_11980 [Mariniblastus sp.]